MLFSSFTYATRPILYWLSTYLQHTHEVTFTSAETSRNFRHHDAYTSLVLYDSGPRAELSDNLSDVHTNNLKHQEVRTLDIRTNFTRTAKQT